MDKINFKSEFKSRFFKFIEWNKNGWENGGVQRWKVIGIWVVLFIVISPSTEKSKQENNVNFSQNEGGRNASEIISTRNNIESSCPGQEEEYSPDQDNDGAGGFGSYLMDIESKYGQYISMASGNLILEAASQNKSDANKHLRFIKSCIEIATSHIKSAYNLANRKDGSALYKANVDRIYNSKRKVVNDWLSTLSDMEQRLN